MKKKLLLICSLFIFIISFINAKANVVVIDPDGIKSVWHFNEDKLKLLSSANNHTSKEIVDYLLTIDYQKYLDKDNSDRNIDFNGYDFIINSLSYIKELNSGIEACLGPFNVGTSNGLIYFNIFDYQLFCWNNDFDIKTGPMSIKLNYTGIIALGDYIYDKDYINSELSLFNLELLITL